MTYNNCQRTENLKLSTTINGSEKERLKKAKKVMKFDIDIDSITEIDELNVNYNFTVEYFGKCVETIQFFSDLIKEGHVIHADLECLNHTECLIQTLFDSIQKIKSQKSIEETQ